MEAVGYNDDFEAYTLCECISAAFSVVGVAPMVLINVLDPAKHKADISEKTMQVNDGVAVLDEVGVLLEGLTIKADATPLEAGKGLHDHMEQRRHPEHRTAQRRSR